VLEVLIPVLFGFEANKDAVEAPMDCQKKSNPS
jgi:hypothetical protein